MFVEIDIKKVGFCKHCGKPFKKTKHKKYCSDKCRIQYNNLLINKRVCRVCGKRCYGRTCWACFSRGKGATVSRLLHRREGVVENV